LSYYLIIGGRLIFTSCRLGMAARLKQLSYSASV